MVSKITVIPILILLVVTNAFPQDNSEKEFINVTPGAKYDANWLHRFFFGDHWRDLWTVPVEVEVLDLDKFAGGLTPVKRGGGKQTKSLRFKGNDGNFWKFRSVDKDPSKILPPVLRTSIFADIIQDQISSANPFAPLVVAPILDAVGILQARPYVVYMPDDPKLGEYRDEFAGLLGMIEIHPDVEEDQGIGFGDAEKVKGTFKLMKRLEDKRGEKVESKEFLKARLVDIFLGDWDRHVDQWRWARYEKSNEEHWHPIPRDRDQAFAKFDGLLVRVAEYLVPQFNHFGYEYNQIEDLTWSGRFLDRRYLSELTKDQWMEVTQYVYNKLTDDVIDNAVKALPPAQYEIAAEELTSKLKSRRDKLFEASLEFYELINDVVDIFCSEDEDYVEINFMNNSQTEVVVYRKDDATQGPREEPIYRKVFDNELTSEIRVYLGDDDDRIVINGGVDTAPLVRIIGGDGGDDVIDNSKVNGYFCDITPIPDAENNVLVYDSGKKTKIEYGPGTCYDDEKVPEPKTDDEKYEPQQRDRGVDWIVNPVVNISSDDGLIFGGGPMLYKYNFRAVPYEYWMTLTAHYATEPNSGTVRYEGIFKSLIKGASLNLKAIGTGLTLTRYYGYGNETKFFDDLEDNDYYKLEQQLLNLSAILNFELFGNFNVGIGTSFKYSDIELESPKLLNSFPEYYGGNFGLGVFRYVGTFASISYDSRDNELNAHEGFYLNLTGSYIPKTFDVKEYYEKISFDTRFYYTPFRLDMLTFALRAGGGKTFGNYPFFDSQFLGGSDNLRGYRRERFSGDAMLFGQAELRTYLADIRLLIPGQFGFSVFGETGRVFTGNSDSKKWHPSYGGGLWISYLERMVTLSVTLAHSDEGWRFWAGTKMMF